MAFVLYECIDNWTKLIENDHVTDASKSLRDKADEFLNITQTIRKGLQNVM